MTRNVLPDCFTFCNTAGRMGDGGKRYGKGRMSQSMLSASDGSENVRVESPLCCYWPGHSAELIRQSVQLACYMYCYQLDVVIHAEMKQLPGQVSQPGHLGASLAF